MKIYKTFSEVEKDLKMLDLQRQISYQELVSVKSEFQEIAKPLNWVQSLIKLSSKYGFLLLIKKIFK